MFLDFIFNFGNGVIERSVSRDRLSIFVNDELGEVPLDEVSQHATLLGFQVLEEWVSVAAVHVDLAEHVEGGSLGRCEGLDLRVGARLLTPELVAREGENP